MNLVLIGIASIILAFVFDALPIWKISKSVLNLQKESFNLIYESKFSDEQKQKRLLSISGKILLSTFKLIGLFIIVALPFIGSIFIGNWISPAFNFTKDIISLKGILVSTFAFILYYFIKRNYGRFRL
jgi:hypothetical protein